MNHDEFVAAYRAGRVRVHIDRTAAARFVSARMMLPVLLLPVLGTAVALALLGHPFTGLALFLLALAFRHAVRASSQGYLLARALREPRFYDEVRASGVLRVGETA